MMPGADIISLRSDTTALRRRRRHESQVHGRRRPDAAGTGFTFKVEDITSGGATVTVETTKEPVTYIWDVISDASYTQLGGNAEALVSHVTDMFALYGTAQYGNLTPVQVIAGLGAWYSGASYAYGKLSSKTAYRPYAACVDLSGNVVGTPAVGEIFTTLEAVAGSATVEAAYDQVLRRRRDRCSRSIIQCVGKSVYSRNGYLFGGCRALVRSPLYRRLYGSRSGFRSYDHQRAEVSGREGCRED